jgi:hypothetical protein
MAALSGVAVHRQEGRSALQRAAMVWAPEVRGALCHRLIAELCERDVADPHAIEAHARPLLPRGLAQVHEQALLAFLVPMAGSYLLRFRRPGWRFVGSEVIVGGVALDLLWEASGRLQADEVKSSVSIATAWRPHAAEQARAQAVVGRAHYGEAFEGVRVVALAIPAETFWVAA